MAQGLSVRALEKLVADLGGADAAHRGGAGRAAGARDG